jgi:hypothetical protein
MTSSTINFTADFEQKMQALCQLHAESNIPANQGAWANRERYIALRREVAGLLDPLFTDLNFTEMLVLWTKPTADNSGRSTIDTLEYNGENSGLQMSIKEYNNE